jgi:protein translocase SEC61 complex gamma subunit
MEESQESKPIETPKQEEVKKEEKPVEKKPGIFSRFINRFLRYRRVLEISKKPDKQELMSSIKVTLLGIALIGGIGFVIYLAYFAVVP